MYGFLLRPKWIAFHLVVFAGVALMVWLGLWQLQRLDERREFNAVVTERFDVAPVPLDELLATTEDPGAIEWRQVTVSGSWLPDQIIWYNRSQEGLAGDNVLTALSDADGASVVVNRGFVPLGSVIPEAPAGEVQILGRVRAPHVRQRGELTDRAADTVTEVRRVDLDQLDAQIPGALAPVFLDLIATVPPVTDADPAPAPAPELDEGPHLSYAMQWFIFAMAVLVGWVLAVRRSIATRRRPASAAVVTDAAAVRTLQDSLPAGGDEAARPPI